MERKKTHIRKTVKAWVAQFIKDETAHGTPKKTAIKWAKEICTALLAKEG